jgi:hypothetical protein
MPTPSFSPLSALSNAVSRVRRNHALEHATIHVLSERRSNLKVAGRSSPWGFYLYGNVPTQEVLAAAQEGLRRLRAGKKRFAVHPNCGSNLVLTGSLAGLGAFLAAGEKSESRRERLARLPWVVAVATLGVILAQPLGMIFQARVTTQAETGRMGIVGVTREEKGSLVVHHIRTEDR